MQYSVSFNNNINFSRTLLSVSTFLQYVVHLTAKCQQPKALYTFVTFTSLDELCRRCTKNFFLHRLLSIFTQRDNPFPGDIKTTLKGNAEILREYMISSLQI